MVPERPGTGRWWRGDGGDGRDGGVNMGVTVFHTQFRCPDCGKTFWVEVTSRSRTSLCGDCGSEDPYPVDKVDKRFYVVNP